MIFLLVWLLYNVLPLSIMLWLIFLFHWLYLLAHGLVGMSTVIPTWAFFFFMPNCEIHEETNKQEPEKIWKIYFA
jgi:hypothetical protein